MILTIECPCCREVIRLELSATYPYNNFKSVEIVQVGDDD